MVGPLFRRYGENRVRNLLRAVDGAAQVMAKADKPLGRRTAAAMAMLLPSLTATLGSSAAATAVGGALLYGLNALPMYLGSGQAAIPLLVNLIGGALPGNIINQYNQDPSLPSADVAGMLLWPFGAALSLSLIHI